MAATACSLRYRFHMRCMSSWVRVCVISACTSYPVARVQVCTHLSRQSKILLYLFTDSWHSWPRCGKSRLHSMDSRKVLHPAETGP